MSLVRPKARILVHDRDLLIAVGPKVQRRAVLVADIDDAGWSDPAEREIAFARRESQLASAAGRDAGLKLAPKGTAGYVVFAEPIHAVRAARDIADDRTRVAIDVGDLELRDEEPVGPPLARAARLVAVAHPGQVILSSTAHDALTMPASVVRSSLPAVTAPRVTTTNAETSVWTTNASFVASTSRHEIHVPPCRSRDEFVGTGSGDEGDVDGRSGLFGERRHRRRLASGHEQRLAGGEPRGGGTVGADEHGAGSVSEEEAWVRGADCGFLGGRRFVAELPVPRPVAERDDALGDDLGMAARRRRTRRRGPVGRRPGSDRSDADQPPHSSTVRHVAHDERAGSRNAQERGEDVLISASDNCCQ